jgi:hypothetical protein
MGSVYGCAEVHILIVSAMRSRQRNRACPVVLDFDARGSVDAEQLDNQCTRIVQRALRDKGIRSDK